MSEILYHSVIGAYMLLKVFYSSQNLDMQYIV